MFIDQKTVAYHLGKRWIYRFPSKDLFQINASQSWIKNILADLEKLSGLVYDCKLS